MERNGCMESRNHIELRTFQEKDFAEVLQLFYDTVRNINSRDYTPEQISAWVLGVDEARMKKALLAHTTLVATSNGTIAGFADMDESGYLDHLYVHQQHQRQGIATMLCDVLETETPAAGLSVHASITAKNFFLRRGYQLLHAQQVERQGQHLTNYRMEKRKT